MTKTQLLALAAFITTLAEGGDAEAAPVATLEGNAEPTPTGKRGRPAKAAAPAAEAPAPEPEPTKAEPAKPAGKTVEELRAAIKDLVTAGRGEEVKTLIKAHGGENLSSIPAANHDAFLKDVEGLSL